MITPLRNNVYIAPLQDPDRSEGGIIIPESAKSRADQGIVKYIGPEVEELRVGDFVLFSPYSGSVVDLEGEGRMMIMSEEAVELIVDNVGDLVISGLYFEGKEGEFHPVNYEAIFSYITAELKRNPRINNRFKIKTRTQKAQRFDENKLGR